MADRFRVERVEALRFSGQDGFTKCELMSPYVWHRFDGTFEVLVRAVPGGGGAGDANTGSIWFGRSDDGLLFDIDDAPVLSPDAEGLDANGCEDPTALLHGGELIVFYTGVDADGDGHLLWASGADVRALEKRGVAAKSFRGERDIKEAEVAVRDGRWTMGYEYARGEASMIGYAEGDGPAGPWRKTKHGFGARHDRFDSWHLSPGPMLLDDPDRPIMFNNGATHEGVWGDRLGRVRPSEQPCIGPLRRAAGRAARRGSRAEHGIRRVVDRSG